MMNPIERFRSRLQNLESAISSLSSDQLLTKDQVNLVTNEQRAYHSKTEDSIYRLEKGLERTGASFPSITPPKSGDQANILVAGFFGAFNLGDELILETTLSTLKQTHPTAKVTIMLADNFSCDISRYGDYDFIHYPNTPLEINSIARYYDAVIFPGGAIIDDVEYNLRKRPLTLGAILVTLSLRFTAMNKPCILYGLSTNTTLENADFINKVDRIAKAATHFSLRDENSLMTLKNSGVDTSKIAIVDDIVIAHPLIKTTPSNTTDEIGLIFIYTSDLFEKIESFTRNLLEETPDTIGIKLILFYDYDDNDLSFARKLVSTIGDPRLSIESDTLGDYARTVEQIQSKQAIISMRYHGTLLANFLGRRTICINYSQHRHYSNKNSYLYSHYGFTKQIIEISDIDSIASKSLLAMLKSEVKKVDTATVQAEAHKRLIKILEGIK